MDYKKLKLKIGLEIHQQLNTKKLFCNCNSILRDDKPDFIIERKLHPVPGESGVIDKAVEYEKQQDKKFIYEAYNTNCLVELDESPPYEINKEALKIVLQISILLHAEIFPITQIMRKMVIDGSNTSGFQRTVLIAKNGYIETSAGKIKIESICLEEDSARIIEKKQKQTIYRLDRLGIPLIEIATAPEIHSPNQAKEAALEIGKILRNFKIKRGLGTIRQDVNLSIYNGSRIELKGVQNMKTFTKVIEEEIKREDLLYKKNGPPLPQVRGVINDFKTEFLRPMPGADRMYPETDLPLLKISKKMINEAKKDMPKQIKDIKNELKEQGLNLETINILLKENKVEEFKELLKIINSPKLIAKILVLLPKEISSHEKIPINEINSKINQDILIFILEKLKQNKISEFQIKEVLKRLAKGEPIEKAIIFNKKIENLEEEIYKIIKSSPGLSENAYMGIVMKKFKGIADGKEIRKIIKEIIN